jgi:hypothetical protein
MVDENTVFEAMQGDLDAAVDIGLKAKVDIVIVGTAVTTRQGDKNYLASRLYHPVRCDCGQK